MSTDSKIVLCVEDNPTNLLLISRITEAENLQLVVAENGLYAEELLQTVSPDLILMDVNLPGIDGLELTRRIRANESLPHMPIIATTANVLVGDRERCMEAGCDDYMPKPLDIRELRKLIRYYLELYEIHQKAEQAKLAEAEASSPATEPSTAEGSEEVETETGAEPASELPAESESAINAFVAEAVILSEEE